MAVTVEEMDDESVNGDEKSEVVKSSGTKQLKKNIKRHLPKYEGRVSAGRIKCDFKGCLHTFSTKSNLAQHVKAVHLEIKPFVCSLRDCSMRFSYKHGDSEDSDEQLLSRPRGGCKRKCPSVESLIRKRVCSTKPP
ncbi:transcription factor IIIA-like isoform X3 [Tripterygium wilfordii]|uniref:Transcription factor IIIA-like isoform X3 n=1 Tax=Tripterygium wilfordii TaxID=458696 RepID=A0A7J7BYL7_TRIWF|nr:transcription factor IIIA-like isoform X3 [Tripterygium wilfordii]